MHSIKRTAIILLALVAGVVLVGAGHAMGNNPDKTKNASLTRAYVWYDGDKERTAYLNPNLVADFDAKGTEKSAVKRTYPEAKEIPVKGGARIWQVDRGAEIALPRLRAAQPSAKYSPVLHDSPSAGGRMRALPGNVIVYLNPDWGQAKVAQWAAKYGLSVLRELDVGKNVYVIQTAPGLEALQTANALYKSGEVVAAFPDWWLEVATR